jgi:ribosomal protein S18 acetylase RimI-like enzyme
MPFILTDFSPNAVAAAIERNGIECCLSWASWPEMELHRSDQMVWTLTDVPFPFFNNVFNANLDGLDIDSAIEETIDRFRCRNVPAFWWTGPATRPADLGKHLQRAGLEHAFQAPAMAVDLHKMNQATSPPGGLTIEKITDEAGLRDWCHVMTPLYQFPDFAAKPWFRMLASLGLGPAQPLCHFLARLDGAPVATASLYLGAGVAGISSVGTLPDHRHRGIGTALTVAAFQEAKPAGYRIGTLFSSVMGRRMYQRIGFQQYAQGHCYVWTPDSSLHAPP